MLLTILLLLVVLLLVALVQNPLLFRAAPGSLYAGLEVQQRSPSVLYEVFKPAIDPYNELVEFFRPSNLQQYYYVSLLLNFVSKTTWF